MPSGESFICFFVLHAVFHATRKKVHAHITTTISLRRTIRDLARTTFDNRGNHIPFRWWRDLHHTHTYVYNSIATTNTMTVAAVREDFSIWLYHPMREVCVREWLVNRPRTASSPSKRRRQKIADPKSVSGKSAEQIGLRDSDELEMHHGRPKMTATNPLNNFLVKFRKGDIKKHIISSTTASESFSNTMIYSGK